MLNVLAEKLLPQGIIPELVAYCPTMDLIALATADQQVSINRLNGQHVFHVSTKMSKGKPVGIEWKPNGMFRSLFSVRNKLLR